MAQPSPQHSTDMVIIGAGIVGSCCAWHLARAGDRVMVLDPRPPGDATSYGNAGAISPTTIAPFSHPGVLRHLPRWLTDREGPLRIRSGFVPRMLPWLREFLRHTSPAEVQRLATAQHALMNRSIGDHQQLSKAAGCGDLLLGRGAVALFDNPRDWAAEAWSRELLAEFGIRQETLPVADCLALIPGLQLGPDAVVQHLPDWFHIADPGAYTKAVAQSAAAHGATFRRLRVRDMTADAGGWRLRCHGSDQVFVTRRLVIAAGVWSNRFARHLDRAVPMAPKRGYHLMLPQAGVDLPLPIHASSHQFMLTPMTAGLRLAGTAEFAAIDAPPDWRRAHLLTRQARRYLPALDDRDAVPWMGRRPMMADGLPVISASPRQPGVYYAFGHGHWGLTQGPTTGRLVTDLVHQRAAPVDLTPYRLDRF